MLIQKLNLQTKLVLLFSLLFLAPLQAGPLGAGVDLDDTLFPQKSSSEIQLRILITRISQDLTIESGRGINIEDKRGRKIFSDSQNTSFQFTRDGKDILLQYSGKIKKLPREIHVYSNARPEVLGINGKKYRGSLRVIYRNDLLWLINRVGLEDYLYSVVPGEFMTRYPQMARAQAVVARTFALGHIDFMKDDCFDFSSSTRFQVYKGCCTEEEISREAIDDTRGLVMASEGRLVKYPLYHSTCGGSTDNNETVFLSAPISYLRNTVCVEGEESQADFSDENRIIDSNNDELCRISKYHRWEVNWGYDEMVRNINEYFKEKDVNEIKKIEVRHRGPSGRAKEIFIDTDKGALIVEGDKIRNLLKFKNPSGNMSSLYSTRFVLTRKGEGKKATWAARGTGWGHGLGMCQFGALELAKRGFDYPEILKKYYQGIEIVPYNTINPR
ncbi:MAG: SpoIID/LytB domain-containing protein [Vulcanimicrobiota bacterium]